MSNVYGHKASNSRKGHFLHKTHNETWVDEQDYIYVTYSYGTSN